ncbi:MAG: hypothetical protein LBT23_08410 [Synergistaceae bacterium]|jgi:hypothetical protein|nr:hypothetical protein [Synergistaceae bacterium]
MSNHWQRQIPQKLFDKYEMYNFNHAVEILSSAYTEEYSEIISALDVFSLSTADIIAGGGNESAIPKKLSAYLHPLDWQEVKITGDLLVKLHHRNSSNITEFTIQDFIDGHNIDYVKNRVAIDMEWNSKDQTFDRDLYAFRTFYECNIISCGAIITRSEQLNPIFTKLGIRQKYGASTTWMGKLLPRISSGRHGGCPLLVIGITPAAITDLEVDDVRA